MAVRIESAGVHCDCHSHAMYSFSLVKAIRVGGSMNAPAFFNAA